MKFIFIVVNIKLKFNENLIKCNENLIKCNENLIKM